MVDENLKNRVDEVRKLDELYSQESWNYNSTDAKRAFNKWIHAVIPLLSDFYMEDNEIITLIKAEDYSDNGLKMNALFNKISPKYEFELHQIESGVVAQHIGQKLKKNLVNNKPPKVFISHKWEDREYADALVDLINFILGADGDKIFCSSIPGYGIKQARLILEELKNQFDNNNIFMVIIHSPRYYQSAVCLNEMGASWVLGTQFASFMTKDCTYDDLRGVIDKGRICINLNDTSNILNAHLNDFKNDLISFFNAKPINENRWETARSRFISEVMNITYKQEDKADIKLEDKREEIVVIESKKNIDFIKSYYIPIFDHIFELLDIDNFKKWGYECAIAGNTALRKSVYFNLDEIVNYIKSRPKNKDYSSWDSLLQNLGQLVSDFNKVFSQHATPFGEDVYIVEKFYKINPMNPRYDIDLEAYNQHIWLVSDMVFELARLCNYILSKIRSLFPEYKKELGLLFLDNDLNSPDLVYRESEFSDSPYPGLKDYISVRLTRETHYGNNPKINPDGYEKS